MLLECSDEEWQAHLFRLSLQSPSEHSLFWASIPYDAETIMATLACESFPYFSLLPFNIATRRILPNAGEADGGITLIKIYFLISWAFQDIIIVIRKSHHKLS